MITECEVIVECATRDELRNTISNKLHTIVPTPHIDIIEFDDELNVHAINKKMLELFTQYKKNDVNDVMALAASRNDYYKVIAQLNAGATNYVAALDKIPCSRIANLLEEKINITLLRVMEMSDVDIDEYLKFRYYVGLKLINVYIVNKNIKIAMKYVEKYGIDISDLFYLLIKNGVAQYNDLILELFEILKNRANIKDILYYAIKVAAAYNRQYVRNLIDLLLDMGGNISCVTSAIFHAVKNNHNALFVNLLDYVTDRINIAYHVLLAACINNNIYALNKAIEFGATSFNIALSVAAKAKNLTLIKILIDKMKTRGYGLNLFSILAAIESAMSVGGFELACYLHNLIYTERICAKAADLIDTYVDCFRHAIRNASLMGILFFGNLINKIKPATMDREYLSFIIDDLISAKHFSIFERFTQPDYKIDINKILRMRDIELLIYVVEKTAVTQLITDDAINDEVINPMSISQLIN